jgi:LmbE family N-acetylglucosaminyl deacetylase
VAIDLPEQRSVLAVCAHPDDESFGLGAALARFCESGAAVWVLCFTHGEASTLGKADDGGLGALRAAELAGAAEVLGARSAQLLGYPDGALRDVPAGVLAHDVQLAAEGAAADLLLVFDEGGVSGHEDHMAATTAALLAADALGLPVLAWALDATVAESLSSALGTRFVGRALGELDIAVDVDRRKQWEAIACHKSQVVDNPVLRGRLAAQGDREVFRWLRGPGGRAGPVT